MGRKVRSKKHIRTKRKLRSKKHIRSKRKMQRKSLKRVNTRRKFIRKKNIRKKKYGGAGRASSLKDWIQKALGEDPEPTSAQKERAREERERASALRADKAIMALQQNTFQNKVE